MGTFFILGKDKAAKGEGWAPHFIRCAQDTVGLYPPLPLQLFAMGNLYFLFLPLASLPLFEQIISNLCHFLPEIEFTPSDVGIKIWVLTFIRPFESFLKFVPHFSEAYVWACLIFMLGLKFLLHLFVTSHRVPLKEWKESRSTILSLLPWKQGVFASTGNSYCFNLKVPKTEIVDFASIMTHLIGSTFLCALALRL